MNSNPFRSEADAFRLLMTICAAAGLVIVTAVLAGSAAGAILLGIFLLVGLYKAARWLREGVREPDA